jgi:hypothetical protein
MAQPILASTLFRVSKNRQADNTEQYAESSCADINGLLRGGVWRGRITCISGERGTGKTLVGPPSRTQKPLWTVMTLDKLMLK